ncbi:MAG TPA: hypothetical protein VF223_13020 [Trebonia sp.]
MADLFFGLLVTLILANYAFTAGGYLYTHRIERRLSTLITNHLRHELDDIQTRLTRLEGGD